MKYSVGQKVRCISDDTYKIKPGAVLTIIKIKTNDVNIQYCDFKETEYQLYFREIEPLNRTIRDVVEGDVVISGSTGNEYRVTDVAKRGFLDGNDDYYTFEFANRFNFTIKQPEQEKQEIEIAEEIGIIAIGSQDLFITENRNLIIELQKLVNKIVKE